MQERLFKAKKATAGANLKVAIETAVETAGVAAAEGKPFCVLRIDVGLDASAVREAVTTVLGKHPVCPP